MLAPLALRDTTRALTTPRPASSCQFPPATLETGSARPRAAPTCWVPLWTTVLAQHALPDATRVLSAHQPAVSCQSPPAALDTDSARPLAEVTSSGLRQTTGPAPLARPVTSRTPPSPAPVRRAILAAPPRAKRPAQRVNHAATQGTRATAHTKRPPAGLVSSPTMLGRNALRVTSRINSTARNLPTPRVPHALEPNTTQTVPAASHAPRGTLAPATTCSHHAPATLTPCWATGCAPRALPPQNSSAPLRSVKGAIPAHFTKRPPRSARTAR